MSLPFPASKPLKWKYAILLIVVAAVCFNAAYTPAAPSPWGLLMVGYLIAVVQLARLPSTRQAFYAGLITGLLCFGPQLAFFWGIFGSAAAALWTILAFWIALFVALTHVALIRLGTKNTVWLMPFLWTGLEYFRSELYYLKFAWLNAGFAFSGWPLLPLHTLGVYGIGFCLAAYAGLFLLFRVKHIMVGSVVGMGVLAVGYGLFSAPTGSALSNQPKPRIAGVQLEFPIISELQQSLDNAITAQPDVSLVVLSEYTLDGPPPQALKDWCREHELYLIVGGKAPADGKNYYNTAFVISTNGEVVFQQAKCVPIQFFKDGRPAPEQKLWDSPWGKIGICICYDLSYSRVTDELARQGAQMLIVPTMDVSEWGRHEHVLHARIAPVRAAEYGIPIFRVASSGISQGVDRQGNVQVSTPFPGEGGILYFATRPGRVATLPLDRWLAPGAGGITGLFIAWLGLEKLRRRSKRPALANAQ